MSSRSTLVITAWRRPMRATDAATRAGSSGSFQVGLPERTLQNPQRRVQVSPRIMKVAVPALPALADVRAGRLGADGVEVLLADHRLHLAVADPAPGRHLEPRRLAPLVRLHLGPSTLSTSAMPPGFERARVEPHPRLRIPRQAWRHDGASALGPSAAPCRSRRRLPAPPRIAAGCWLAAHCRRLPARRAKQRRARRTSAHMCQLCMTCARRACVVRRSEHGDTPADTTARPASPSGGRNGRYAVVSAPEGREPSAGRARGRATRGSDARASCGGHGTVAERDPLSGGCRPTSPGPTCRLLRGPAGAALACRIPNGGRACLRAAAGGPFAPVCRQESRHPHIQRTSRSRDGSGSRCALAGRAFSCTAPRL